MGQVPPPQRAKVISMLELIESQNDWQTEFKEAFKKSSELQSFLEQSIATTDYPIFIPRKLAQQIKDSGKNSALWKQFVPDERENVVSGLKDPIGDLVHLKKGQLIHRYKNRALFMPTSVCPVLCRYCFRKNELNDEKQIFQSDLSETKKYLEQHPEINEIIFSGGDPFILRDEKIDQYLSFFSGIESIKYIRFHTRTPIIIASRINKKLVEILNFYSDRFIKISIVIHLNHATELNDENRTAIKDLSKLPIQLLSQSVLLKGINDNDADLIDLFNELIELGVRPYYLHHPDQVKGGMHFYLPLEEGRKIFAKLRDQLPGWALPQYVVDIPGGFGKTQAYNPETFEFNGKWISKDNEIILTTIN